MAGFIDPKVVAYVFAALGFRWRLLVGPQKSPPGVALPLPPDQLGFSWRTDVSDTLFRLLQDIQAFRLL